MFTPRQKQQSIFFRYTYLVWVDNKRKCEITTMVSFIVYPFHVFTVGAELGWLHKYDKCHWLYTTLYWAQIIQTEQNKQLSPLLMPQTNKNAVHAMDFKPERTDDRVYGPIKQPVSSYKANRTTKWKINRGIRIIAPIIQRKICLLSKNKCQYKCIDTVMRFIINCSDYQLIAPINKHI